MHTHKPERYPRQPDCVQCIKPRKRHRADFPSAAQHLRYEFTQYRCSASDFHTHHSCPIRLLIPWQQIASEAKSEHDEEQQHADYPCQFTRCFVGAVNHHAEQVQEDDDYHRARAPVVQAAHERAERHFFRDIGDSVMRVFWRRRVVEC